MKILGVQFDYAGRNDYERLARVFAKSVELNCPAAELTIARIEPPRATKKNAGLTSNWHKFKAWRQFIADQRDGEHVVLCDVDMLCLGDLRVAFIDEFDIGLTRRTAVDWPYNGGVVFVQCGQRAAAFIDQWAEIDDQMYRDAAFHEPYLQRYRGQNQASLGWMTEHNPCGATIREFPCAIWNACNEDWHAFGPHVRMLHVKSTLRFAALAKHRQTPSKMADAITAWRKVEAQL